MKKKVVTITFSPSIDKSVSVKKLIPETKMKCFDEESYPGGGGINIARVLTRFGSDVTALFPADQCNSPFFEKMLNIEKVKHVSVQIKNKTRENLEVFDEHSKKQFRFVMPSNELSEEEWNACIIQLQEFKKIDFLVVSGSLPPNAPPTIFNELSKIALSKKAKFIIDTSGKSLKQAIKEPLFLIKPNLEEFAILTGNKMVGISNLKKIAHQFLQDNQCENIVISLGSKGAMLFNENEMHYIKPPKVKVISTVGAGDSMLAGILVGLEKEASLEECLRLGIACGTATTLKAGTSLCTKADVDHLLPKIA